MVTSIFFFFNFKMSTAQRKMSKTTKNNTNEKYKKRPKQKKRKQIVQRGDKNKNQR